MKLKKLLSFVAAAAMAVTALTGAITASAVNAGDVVDSGQVGENVTYKIYGDGRLIISGTGPMYENGSSDTWGWNDDSKKVWDNLFVYPPITGVTEVIIEEGVTTVGERAFFVGTYSLEKVTLPSTLVKIEPEAFSTCIHLNEVKGLANATGGLEFGANAFGGSKVLETVEIPDNAILNTWAFSGCDALKTVTLGDNVTLKSSGQFEKCPALENIYIYNRELAEEYITEPDSKYPTFDMTNNPTFHVYKGSATEQALRNKGYIIDIENIKDINLEYLIDFSELEKAIAEAEALDTANHTEESVAGLAAAIEQAKSVLKNIEAAQEEIDSATQALNAAIAGLAEKPTKPDPTKPEPSKPTTKTPAKTTASTKATRSAAVVAKEKKAAEKAMKQAKITKLKVKSKAKKINVTWKKVKKAVGYEVQVSTKKNFKKLVLTKTTAKKKLVIKNNKIKSGKKYFVRVRAYATYKNANGTAIKVYSNWNKKLRTVKVK